MASKTFNIKPYLELGRISNLPTVISNVLLGFILISNEFSFFTAILMILSGFCFYLAGMYMNDICDFEWDKENKNTRPLVKGEVELKTVKLILRCFFALALFFYTWALFLNKSSFLALLYPFTLVVFISWYNFDHKDNFFSPLLMGLCRVFLILSASALINPQLNLNKLMLVITYLSYTGALTYCAKFEHSKSFQIKLLPKFFYLIAPFFLYFISPKTKLSLIILSIICVWNLFNLYQLSQKKIGHYVTNSIAAMILIDALIIVQNNYEKALIMFVLFIFTLIFQRKIAGT